MPDVLQSAICGMAAALRQCRGQPIVYTAGTERVGLIATQGMARREVEDEAGMAITVDRTTWVFPAVALAFPAGSHLPAAGDTIATTGPVPQTFEVLPPDPRKPPYDYPDPGRHLIRVYSKQIV